MLQALYIPNLCLFKALPVRVNDDSRQNRRQRTSSGEGTKSVKPSGSAWRHALQEIGDSVLMKSASSSLTESTSSRVDIHPMWKEEALQHEWMALKASLQQQLLHVDNLLRSPHLGCVSLSVLDRIVRNSKPGKGLSSHLIAQFEFIAKDIHELVIQETDDKMSEPCALLYLEKAFISAILQMSESLYDFVSNGFEGGDSVFEEEMLTILNAILSEALDASNVFVGKGHFSRHGFSQESINHALARIAQMALRTARQLVSRPLVMHPPQNIYKHRKSGIYSTRLIVIKSLFV